MGAMPQTGKFRPEITPGYAVHLSSIGLIGAMHADLRLSEPGLFLSKVADGASPGAIEAATDATGKTCSALKTRNRP